MKKQRSKFQVIATNVQTDNRVLLPDVFSTYKKCQDFVEKMNNKYTEQPVVFIATVNLAGISKKQIEYIFQQPA